MQQPEYLVGESRLRDGMRIDWYSVEYRARNWGKGRSKAAARRRTARARKERQIWVVTKVDQATKTVTVRSVVTSA